jgi:excisionase family DNA binding protein
VKKSFVPRVTHGHVGVGADHRRAASVGAEAARGGGRRTLTVEEAARALGISRSTAYECVRNGTIPSLRFRRRIVISAVVIDRLLDGTRPVNPPLDDTAPSAPQRGIRDFCRRDDVGSFASDRRRDVRVEVEGG